MEKENLIYLNVSGQLYLIDKTILGKYPETMLGKMFYREEDKQKWDIEPLEYKKNIPVYYFDRDPVSFNVIYNYYRTGKLYITDNVSIDILWKELAYWGIEEERPIENKNDIKWEQKLEYVREIAEKLAENYQIIIPPWKIYKILDTFINYPENNIKTYDQLLDPIIRYLFDQVIDNSTNTTTNNSELKITQERKRKEEITQQDVRKTKELAKIISKKMKFIHTKEFFMMLTRYLSLEYDLSFDINSSTIIDGSDHFDESDYQDELVAENIDNTYNSSLESFNMPLINLLDNQVFLSDIYLANKNFGSINSSSSCLSIYPIFSNNILQSRSISSYQSFIKHLQKLCTSHRRSFIDCDLSIISYPRPIRKNKPFRLTIPVEQPPVSSIDQLLSDDEVEQLVNQLTGYFK